MKNKFSLRDEFKHEAKVSTYDAIPAYADWLEDKLLEKLNNVAEPNRYNVLADGWRDDLPNNNRNVLIYYKCHGVEVQTTGYYDSDHNSWYDWSGDEIEEKIIGWVERLPVPPPVS